LVQPYCTSPSLETLSQALSVNGMKRVQFRDREPGPRCNNCYPHSIMPSYINIHSDYSPGTLKFPDFSRHSSLRWCHGAMSYIPCYYYATKHWCSPKKLTINSFSLTFGQFPDMSLTAVKFPDISRFSRQVVTLNTIQLYSTPTVLFTIFTINAIYLV